MFFPGWIRGKYDRAIVGLGNPGGRYALTRHNLGYRVVESFSGLIKVKRVFNLRHSNGFAVGYRSQRLLLVQPRTFMNLSGRAVAELMRCCRFKPDQIIVIYDDLDLAPGWIRFRSDGGSGGHRGVQSIIDTVGATGFIRLRIGIGKPSFGDAAAYVLETPSPQEQKLLEQAIERAVEALVVFLEQGLAVAMNRFNRPP